MSETPTGTTFRPGRQAYDQGQTLTTKNVRVRPLSPLAQYRRDYLAGFRDGAGDVKAGQERLTFGSFAATAYAAGYRDAVNTAREQTR